MAKEIISLTKDTLKELEDNHQVAFRYMENPNGSIHDIAGIVNKGRNVLGHDAASGPVERTTARQHGRETDF